MSNKDIFFILLAFISLVSAQFEDECNPVQGKHKTCNDCLTLAGSSCGWCSDLDIDGVVGCVPSSTKCQKKIEVKGAVELETRAESLFIQPSQVRLKMRPNLKKTISFTASKSELPVDMYFLFDLSKTMESTLKDLAIIAQDLANELNSLTSNRYFGFGTFREKPAPPFDIQRSYAHDFEHHMPLNDDISLFTSKVKETVNIVGNIDNPEAGFDALMQVLLCTNEIGWRNGSTHIIVYISDATPHTAGDGILGGTWKSYQHTCQLTPYENKLVYKSLQNDYPSFSAICYQLKKQETFLIVGLKKYVEGYYRHLKDSHTLQASIGLIDNDGKKSSLDTLKSLILNTYKVIKDKLIIQSSVSSKNLEVNLNFGPFSNCEDRGEEGPEISCNKVNVNQQISFVAEIQLLTGACNSSLENLEIKVFGQEKSTLSVIIEPDCICDCWNTPPQNTNYCGNMGVLKCGTCDCEKGSYGEQCQCQSGDSDSLNDLKDNEKCKSETGQICSNHGTCSCGTCKCKPSFLGKFCECNLRDCKCGKNGNCDICLNGELKCVCNKGWELGQTGQCDCSTAQDKCFDPFTNTTCNNNGDCICNQCECRDFGGYYCQQPATSELTIDIQERSCRILEPCILYYTFSHILDKNEKDESLLSKMKEDCDETNLISNDRIKCFTAMDETVMITDSTDVNFFEDEQVTLANYQGVTPMCKVDLNTDLTQFHQCTASFKRCQFLFWHDGDENGVDGYTNENFMKKINIIIKYSNKTNNPLIQYNEDVDLDYELTPVTCPSYVDKWLIIGIVAGIAVFIFLSCFIVYFILVNLYDRWEYQRFKADADGIWEDGNVHQNRLGIERRKSTFGDRVRNRMSRMSIHY